MNPIHPDEATRASARFKFDAEILAAYPGVQIAVVVGHGLENGPSDSGSRQALEDAANSLRQRMDHDAISSDPHIQAWRTVYRAFGSKPSKYLSSAEALAARAMRGDSGLPEINRLVDHYNAISVEHLVPIGGEDLDAVEGNLVLRFAREGDAFDVADASGADRALVPPGEVVWADDGGVTCRRWNWRQGRRTRLTEATTNAYFIVEAMPPVTAEKFRLVLEGLRGMLIRMGRARHVEVHCLASTPSAHSATQEKQS